MSRTSSFFCFRLFFTCFRRQLAEYFMIFVLYFYAVCSELMLINSINRKIEEAEDVTDIIFFNIYLGIRGYLCHRLGIDKLTKTVFMKIFMKLDHYVANVYGLWNILRCGNMNSL